MDTDKIRAKIMSELGSHIEFVADRLFKLSMTGQPCDVTFYRRKPALDVVIDQKLNIAMMYGAGVTKMMEMLSSINLSNGEKINIRDIWTLNPMPKGGLSNEQLASIDLSEGEERIGPNGETTRKMISDTYHCSSKEEEDFFLRRFLAS